jgi:hypothetical protein
MKKRRSHHFEESNTPECVREFSLRGLPHQEVKSMNHLFSSAVFAAAVTVGVSGSAQTPTSPYPPPSSQPTPSYTQSGPSTSQLAPYTQQTAPYAQQAPTQPPNASAAPAPYSTTGNATEPMPRRHAVRGTHKGRYLGHARRVQRTHHGARSSAPSDNIADELNRQELGRVLSGSSMGSAGYQPEGYAPQTYPAPGQPLSGAGGY